jgi:lipopolysaccharide/colanic/teichoic acid biosynthesis glycosyltransferase
MFDKNFESNELIISSTSYPSIGFNIPEYYDRHIELGKVYTFFKRILDILFSVLGLTLLMPLYIFIVCAIRLDTKGKVLYKHKRIGKNGNYIYLYKFRTMVSDAGNFAKYFSKEQMEEYYINYKLDNDPRITRIGRILRKTSLDELPQLLNILKGEMSLIGPRPVVDGEIDNYGLNKRRFLSVKPGLTGWWACNGRSATTYEERMKLELYYVNNFSFSLDVRCFFKTFIEVLRRNGAK